MSKDKLAGAISQRRDLPPIQRGKGVQISTENERNSEIAEMQKSKVADLLVSEDAKKPESQIAGQQESELAIQQSGQTAKAQISEFAEQQSSDLATSQPSEIADKQKSKKQSSEIAEVRRINRGVTLPEDLFQEYKLGGVLLKVNMHRLMEEALTAYLPELRARIEHKH